MESLADKVVYRQILDDGSKMNLVVKGSINGQLHHKVVQLLVDEKTQVRFHLCECLCFTACEQVQQQLQQSRERANEIEQRLTRENLQLIHEKEQV